MPICHLAAALRVRVVAGLEAGAGEGGAGRGGEGGVVPPRRPGDGGQLLGRGQGQGQGLVLQKVPSELHPKVCNHGEGPY